MRSQGGSARRSTGIGIVLASLIVLTHAPAHARPIGDVAGGESVDLADATGALARAVGRTPTTLNDLRIGDVAPGAITDPGTTPPAFTPAGDGALGAGDAVVVLLAAAGAIAMPSGDVAFPVEIDVTAPSSDVFVLESAPPLEVSYRTDGTSTIATGTLAFFANEVPLPAACTFRAAGATCAPATPLPEGAVTLRAYVESAAGEAADAFAAFTVDTVPLPIAFTSPAAGAIVDDDAVAVSGTVGGDVAAFRINDVEIVPSGGTFAATVPLREGTNTLVALAEKPSGLTTTETLEVTRDPFAPIVRIETPSDGFVAVVPRVTVTGYVNDMVTGGAEPEVFVNGVQATVARGAFMVPDLPLKRGPNRIFVWAVDAVGNEGTDEVDVVHRVPAGARLGILSGNAQSGRVSTLLADPLVAFVEDASGNPVSGRIVTFATTRGDGVLSADGAEPFTRTLAVATDGMGQATARFRLGTSAGEGNNRVTVSAQGIAGSADFCFASTPGVPFRALMTMGDAQRGAVGQPLPLPLEVLVIDADGNPVPGVDVTFTVEQGGGTIGGLGAAVRATRGDGVARAVLRAGFSEGLNSQLVTAAFAGMADGAGASFVASTFAPGDPARTAFEGVVLDNTQTPIPSATVSIPGTGLSTLTDAEGMFRLEGIPPGHMHLRIDPGTTPRPGIFPPLEFETIAIAGRTNGLGMPILIPELNPANAAVVGGPEDVDLTMEGVGGLTLRVFANSVTFADGSRVGVVSIDQVQLDKVPMPPPSGTIFMPPAWTIQPAGTHFDPPAAITIPNDALAPGRTIDLFQFDHALNQFVNVGKATVTDDARLIVTDPGFGITRAGWGGCGQPQPPTTCASNCDDGDPCTRDYCQSGFCFHIYDIAPPQNAPDDCMREECQNGAVVSVPDDSETPPQDSPNDCIRTECQGGAQIILDDDSERPVDYDTDPTDCIKIVCDSGEMLIVVDEAEIPPQDAPDDCIREICDESSLFPLIVNDDSEIPPQVAIDDDCRDYFCQGGEARFQPNDLETPPQASETDCLQQICENGVVITIPFPEECAP